MSRCAVFVLLLGSNNSILRIWAPIWRWSDPGGTGPENVYPGDVIRISARVSFGSTGGV